MTVRVKASQTALLLLIGGLCLTSLCLAQEDSTERLKALDREINNLQKALEALSTEKSRTITDIERYRLAQEKAEAEIRKLDIQIEQTRERIPLLQNSIAEHATLIEEHKQKVSGILRKMYIRGGHGLLKALLSVKSSRELGLAHTYLSYIARDDLETIGAYQAALQDLEEDRRKLDDQMQTLSDLRGKQENSAMAAERARRDKEQLLDDIRNRQQAREKALQEKQQARRELVELIARLERNKGKPESVTTLATSQGRLPWPVAGRVTARFGRIRDDIYDVELDNDGIDISASKGTPVTAVGDGTVVFASWHDAGGNMVVVDHGSGYYTIYAHLSRFDVSVNDTIVSGAVIGAVGDSGSLKGPLLRFEIRKITKDGEQRALDPLKWLRKR